MAQVIYVPEDTRHADTTADVGDALGTVLAARRQKKLEKEFDKAFDMVNTAPDYKTAIESLGSVDPQILSNKEAISLLTDQVNRRFPEQDVEEVVNAQGKVANVNFPKGKPLTDEELAGRGMKRKNVAGIDEFFSMDEDTGEVDYVSGVTATDAQARDPKRLLTPVKDAGAAAQLKNAFANLQQNQIQRDKLKQDKATQDDPTQFEQEVGAIAQRLQLDLNNPEQRNRAINVHHGSDDARSSYSALLTKTVGDTVALTAPDVAGAVAVGSSFLEPTLANEGSPDDASRAAYSAFAYTYLNNPNKSIRFGPETVKRLQRDFTDITGFISGDANLRRAIADADGQLRNGQVGTIDVYDDKGEVIGSVTVAKQGNKTIPISGSKN